MSCPDCEARQDAVVGEDTPHVYVRVGNGNVELVGCPWHLAILVNLIREGGNNPTNPATTD
jgi:hypothetical protein